MKITVLSLAFVFCAVLMAGCSTDAETNPAKAPESTSASSEVRSSVPTSVSVVAPDEPTAE